MHHHYAADLSAAHITSQEQEEGDKVIHSIPAPHFRASKPDPLLQENVPEEPDKSYEANAYDYKLAAEENTIYGKSHLSLLHQQLESPATPTKPLIKIEYHAPPDALKQNYKDLQEFKELSGLIGKSPEDQIHGLTYLLAKEMQSKLQLQRQQKQLQADIDSQKAKESTAPLLFHPEGSAQLLPKLPVTDHAVLGVQPGRLIGMAKTKQYIPIVEHTPTEEKEQTITVTAAPLHTVELKVPNPHSYVDIGLSPNYPLYGGKLYATQTTKKVLPEQVLQYPTLTHQLHQTHQPSIVSVGSHHGLQQPHDGLGVSRIFFYYFRTK